MARVMYESMISPPHHNSASLTANLQAVAFLFIGDKWKRYSREEKAVSSKLLSFMSLYENYTQRSHVSFDATWYRLYRRNYFTTR